MWLICWAHCWLLNSSAPPLWLDSCVCGPFGFSASVSCDWGFVQTLIMLQWNSKSSFLIRWLAPHGVADFRLGGPTVVFVWTWACWQCSTYRCLVNWPGPSSNHTFLIFPGCSRIFHDFFGFPVFFRILLDFVNFFGFSWFSRIFA